MRRLRREIRLGRVAPSAYPDARCLRIDPSHSSSAGSPLRRLPELVDVLHHVEYRVLQLAAHLLDATDVRRDHRVLLVIEPERAARRLEADLAQRLQEARLVFHVPPDGLQRLE